MSETSSHDSTLAASQVDTRVQTAIRIPEDMWKAVRNAAMDRRITANELWIEAMRQYLNLPASDQAEAREPAA